MRISGPASGESRAVRWYRWVVQCYPHTFRERYAAEMVRIFEEDWKKASAAGASARRKYATHVLWDLLRTLPKAVYGAAPVLWLVYIFEVVLLLGWTYFEPRAGACAVVYLAVLLMARFGPRPGGPTIFALAAAWTPIGYGLMRLSGFGSIAYQVFSEWIIGYGLVLAYAAFISFWVSFFVWSWRPTQSVRSMFGRERIALLVGMLALTVGLNWGGVRGEVLVPAIEIACFFLVASSGLFRRVWRGARFRWIGAPLFIVHPLRWD